MNDYRLQLTTGGSRSRGDLTEDFKIITGFEDTDYKEHARTYSRIF